MEKAAENEDGSDKEEEVEEEKKDKETEGKEKKEEKEEKGGKKRNKKFEAKNKYNKPPAQNRNFDLPPSDSDEEPVEEKVEK